MELYAGYWQDGMGNERYYSTARNPAWFGSRVVNAICDGSYQEKS